MVGSGSRRAKSRRINIDPLPDLGHLCDEDKSFMRINSSVVAYPGPPALQANILCKEPFERLFSCHSGSQLVLLH
jgi:hypothetical protein